MDQKITLILTPLKFYTAEDEDLFFEWIKKIKCIQEYKGVGKELHLSIQSTKLSFHDVASLRGLFKRYKIKNIDQLNVFINEENKCLFE